MGQEFQKKNYPHFDNDYSIVLFTLKYIMSCNMTFKTLWLISKTLIYSNRWWLSSPPWPPLLTPPPPSSLSLPPLQLLPPSLSHCRGHIYHNCRYCCHNYQLILSLKIFLYSIHNLSNKLRKCHKRVFGRLTYFIIIVRLNLVNQTNKLQIF